MISTQTEAQINLTKADLDGSYLNTTRTTYGFGDSLTVNLGTASSSPQSFDFSSISKGIPENRDTSVFDYLPSTGQWKADSFSGSNACAVATQTGSFGPYEFTLSVYLYFSTENDGAYALGGAIRQQITPAPPPPFSPDSTTYSYFRPKSLQVPLPLTLGTQRTAVDTLYNFDNTTEVSTRTYDANGYGSVTFPDGRTLQSIRIVDDRVELIYQDGVFQSRTRTRHIHFVGQDFTSLRFDVDTSYTSGSTLADAYEFETQGTPTGVQDLSAHPPESFSLAQNYPNPFNPMTVIRYQLPVTSYVILKVYDVLGQEVATLVERELSPGDHEVSFDAGKLSSGIYMYRLVAGSFSKSMKLMVVK
jgi:hypothetical protein